MTQHGLRQLTECGAVEERPQGSQLSPAGSIAWNRDGDAVVIELTRKGLASNHALTLRWDFSRARA